MVKATLSLKVSDPSRRGDDEKEVRSSCWEKYDFFKMNFQGGHKTKETPFVIMKVEREAMQIYCFDISAFLFDSCNFERFFTSKTTTKGL